MNFNIQSLHNWYRGLLQNPKYRWWVVAASIVYLVSPIDLIPDFIPLAGLVDDTLIISLLVAEVAQVAKLTLQSQNTRSSPVSADAASQVVDVQAIPVK
ncbi:YkvA family protein [Chamaesiphon sp. VAR_48_metabat_135_sub]|uniref:YkvA family protein n=1 Tax=Chamaesiphon sp. VAR_48_metabat_135_sub TaxID=2964699 RepID=UPI00286C68A0|nr:YkvA family protein [Chamaesiphon sp. VAR_48_metabat_135_sub]